MQSASLLFVQGWRVLFFVNDSCHEPPPISSSLLAPVPRRILTPTPIENSPWDQSLRGFPQVGSTPQELGMGPPAADARTRRGTICRGGISSGKQHHPSHAEFFPHVQQELPMGPASARISAGRIDTTRTRHGTTRRRCENSAWDIPTGWNRDGSFAGIGGEARKDDFAFGLYLKGEMPLRPFRKILTFS